MGVLASDNCSNTWLFVVPCGRMGDVGTKEYDGLVEYLKKRVQELKFVKVFPVKNSNWFLVSFKY